MAGIYIHIPFCRRTCYYCNFHFSTSLNLRDEVLRSIISEIKLQGKYLENEPIETIYFGGGTPSILSSLDIDKILQTVYATFSVVDYPEITLETNPDDLNTKKLRDLYKVGINRLSIGVQSFNDHLLKYLNRIHSGEKAIRSIKDARKSGFENISVDLIYNITEDEHETVKEDLEILNELQPEHISAYNLTIEPKTVFGVWKNKGRLSEINEDYAARQFDLVITTLEENGYQQYEISNYARDQRYSKHNTSYWKQIKYLGVGPAAHSFDGNSRQYNIANNSKYIKSISEGVIPFEKETLTPKTLANEMIMTGLRTIWGCDLWKLKGDYNYDLVAQNKDYVEQLINRGFLIITDQKIFLTKASRKFTDEITAELMWV